MKTLVNWNSLCLSASALLFVGLTACGKADLNSQNQKKSPAQETIKSKESLGNDVCDAKGKGQCMPEPETPSKGNPGKGNPGKGEPEPEPCTYIPSTPSQTPGQNGEWIYDTVEDTESCIPPADEPVEGGDYPVEEWPEDETETPSDEEDKGDYDEEPIA